MKAGSCPLETGRPKIIRTARITGLVFVTANTKLFALEMVQ